MSTIIKTVWANRYDPRAYEIVTLRTFSGAPAQTRHVVDVEIDADTQDEFCHWLVTYTPRHLHGKHIHFGDLHCYSGFTIGERMLIDAYNQSPEYRAGAVKRVEQMLECYGSMADELEYIVWDWGQLFIEESGEEFIARNAQLMRDAGITSCAVATNTCPTIRQRFNLY